MTRFGPLAALFAASALGGTAALAQSTTPQTTPPQTTPPASTGTAPTTTPTTPTAASYTDADVDQFAGAALAVQKIQQDATVPDADKQTKMSAAVTSSGLTPEKFNAIATASQSDPALMKRIQTAAAAKMPAPSTAPTTGSSGAAGSAGSADVGGSATQ